MPQSVSHVLLGLISYVVVIVTALIPCLWPPELSLVLNSVFWSGTFLLIQSGFIVGYLYRSRGGSGRQARLVLGFLLVLTSALMFSGFESVAKNAAAWQPHFSGTYSSFFIVFQELLAYGKDIIAFGLAAIGANVAASTMVPSSESEV